MKRAALAALHYMRGWMLLQQPGLYRLGTQRVPAGIQHEHPRARSLVADLRKQRVWVHPAELAPENYFEFFPLYRYSVLSHDLILKLRLWLGGRGVPHAPFRRSLDHIERKEIIAQNRCSICSFFRGRATSEAESVFALIPR
jgi:hypothetical protein